MGTAPPQLPPCRGWPRHITASKARVLSGTARSDAVVIAAEVPGCAILRALYHRAAGSESSRGPLGRSCGFSHADGPSASICGDSGGNVTANRGAIAAACGIGPLWRLSPSGWLLALAIIVCIVVRAIPLYLPEARNAAATVVR